MTTIDVLAFEFLIQQGLIPAKDLKPLIDKGLESTNNYNQNTAIQVLSIEEPLLAYRTQNTLRIIKERTAPPAFKYCADARMIQALITDWYQINNFITLDVIYKAYEKAICVHDYCQETEINITTFIADDFPQCLLQIHNPPNVLYYKGDIQLLNQKLIIGVIGSRKLSSIGEEWAYQAGEFLAQKKITTVSGLALGADTLGHLGTLEAGGTTIAFLPNELDCIIPLSNQKLAERIVYEGGCILTEYLPQKALGQPTVTIPPNYQFVERDRLQAGLANGLIVIETQTTGGTMHTIRFAELQKRRPIACLGAQLYTNSMKIPGGNASLIKHNRATAIANIQDLSAFVEQLEMQNLQNNSIPQPTLFSQ